MLCYDKRSIGASPFTIFGVEALRGSAQYAAAMLSANDLLINLRQRGVKNADIARALKLPSSRVAEMFKGVRQLKLDEYLTLVEKFEIEETISPLSEPVARLLVLHLADRLGSEVGPNDPEVEELAQDFRAFSRFAANPKVRQSVEAFQGFLEGLRHERGRTTAA